MINCTAENTELPHTTFHTQDIGITDKPGGDTTELAFRRGQVSILTEPAMDLSQCRVLSRISQSAKVTDSAEHIELWYTVVSSTLPPNLANQYYVDFFDFFFNRVKKKKKDTEKLKIPRDSPSCSACTVLQQSTQSCFEFAIALWLPFVQGTELFSETKKTKYQKV